MIDVTEIMLEFHSVLEAVTKVFLKSDYLEYDWDEWDDLTETAFDCLVVMPIKNIYNFTISNKYANYGKQNKKNSVLVKTKQSKSFLFSEFNNWGTTFDEDGKNFTEFSFESIQHVRGPNSILDNFFPKIEDCKFYVLTNEKKQKKDL